MTGQNKTEHVRNVIFRAILYGKYSPGDRVPAEREIAERMSISRITVRRALAKLEEAKILERVQGRGTFVSTALRGNPQKSDHVALLTSVSEPFALEFIRAVDGIVRKKSLLLVLRLTEEDPQKEEMAAIELVARGVRNLIVWPSGKGYASETFARLRVLGTNMVFFDRMIPGNYADYVGLDNRHAVQTLLERALKAGRRRFVLVSHSGLNADSDRQREEAFLALCNRRRLPHKLVRVPWRGGIEAALLRNRKKWFAALPCPAVICVNDAVAIAVRKVLCKASTAVYGIDGLPDAIAAGIPTYRQPMTQMARHAVRLLGEQQKKESRWKARRIYCKGCLVTQ